MSIPSRKCCRGNHFTIGKERHKRKEGYIIHSVLEEIKKIRSGNLIDVHHADHNRYMVLVNEADRTKTAYYFSVPIRNKTTRRIVDIKFCHHGGKSTFVGSSGAISLNESILFEGEEGSCTICLPGSLSKKTEKTIYMEALSAMTEITPTLNGLLFKVPCSSKLAPFVHLRTDRSFETILSNDRCFSLMKEKFKPFITASCIGCLNQSMSMIAPCELYSQETGPQEYKLSFVPKSTAARYILYEINMHENKLLQDTTVESLHPTLNNAFGGIAYLGDSAEYGEQWLYSRLDFSNLTELYRKSIMKAVLHLPNLNNSRCTLTANRISARFCSFGSNWSNKISMTELLNHSTISNGYYHLDITEVIKNAQNGSNNFVVKSNPWAKTPAVVSTADSYYQPQILEVKFR